MTTETYRLKIVYDSDPSEANPRTQHENLGRMLCWPARRGLGDDNSHIAMAAGPLDHMAKLLEERDPGAWDRIDALCDQIEGPTKYDPKPRYREVAKRLATWYVALPLYVYEHSGITMSVSDFGDRFDSGLVGFIYARKSDLAAARWAPVPSPDAPELAVPHVWTPDDQEWAVKQLTAEVKEYARYIEGEVYGFEIQKLVYRFEVPSEPVEASDDALPWEDHESSYGIIGTDAVVQELGDRTAAHAAAAKAAAADIGKWKLVTAALTG